MEERYKDEQEEQAIKKHWWGRASFLWGGDKHLKYLIKLFNFDQFALLVIVLNFLVAHVVLQDVSSD